MHACVYGCDGRLNCGLVVFGCGERIERWLAFGLTSCLCLVCVSVCLCVVSVCGACVWCLCVLCVPVSCVNETGVASWY